MTYFFEQYLSYVDNQSVIEKLGLFRHDTKLQLSDIVIEVL